ncbi:hypothetical protein [Pricia sp.]|uniref:hypothetical protein n=1 Tax=Pricia sp. TaxID=2268138 RepID=UPI00359334C3
MKRKYNLNECFAISTKWLKQQGFLEQGKLSYTDIEFISAGYEYNVRVVASITTDEPKLIFQFLYEDRTKRIDIELSPRKNHFGGGSFYMVCPKSGKRAEKLYLVNGILSIARASGLHYQSQIKANALKKINARFGAAMKGELAIEELNSKGFVRYRSGKPTKKYKRVLKILKEAEGKEFVFSDLTAF